MAAPIEGRTLADKTILAGFFRVTETMAAIQEKLDVLFGAELTDASGTLHRAGWN